jgi:hypothetical protein
VPVTGEPDLVAACHEKPFDVAVIGQTISDAQKRRVFDLIRQHCPSAKVLELYSPVRGLVLPGADGWLEVPAQVPTDLAQHVEELVANSH